MKKEITVGLVVAIVGGIIVFWLTTGILEENKREREQRDRAETARQQEQKSAAEQREKAARAKEEEANRPKMSMVEENINRNGDDYKDFVASAIQECLQACEREDRCKAITFTKSSRQCWMKSKVPLRIDDPSYSSAVKVGA